MKTILLNGSPKGNVSSSGSYVLAKAFVSSMKEPCEIRAVAKENHLELIEYLRQFERIILITPNYIHAVPSGTLDFLYALPKANKNQSIGFIIQSGYPEASESEIIGRFFKKLASRRGYGYLGTIVKGECAGLAIMPQKFDKLKEKFAQFGVLYEQTGCFDKGYAKDFAEPYVLSKPQMWFFNRVNPIGNYLGWHKIMKSNRAFDHRLDTPYLDKSNTGRAPAVLPGDGA